MINFVKNDIDVINEQIELTAQIKGLNVAIVEKDFWVSYMLDYLFNRCQYKDYFEFKGGTSLSKAYSLIERFSEDIDIVLNSSILGYDLLEIINQKSNNQKEKLAESLNNKALDFYQKVLIPSLQIDLTKETSKNFDIRLEKDELAIYVKYPSNHQLFYIRNEIKIEIGPLAAWTPFEYKKISSFVAQEYPQLFSEKEFNVKVTKPIRTFWEKAVILHQEAHREDGNCPRRYSRHYYDIYKMYNSFVKEDAIKNMELLSEVREFTKTFYNRGWAKFDEARPGTFMLYPNNNSINALLKDYDDMKIMIYGDIPEFKEILETMKKLENEINEREE